MKAAGFARVAKQKKNKKTINSPAVHRCKCSGFFESTRLKNREALQKPLNQREAEMMRLALSCPLPTKPSAIQLEHTASLLTAATRNFCYDTLRTAFDDRSCHRFDVYDLVALSLEHSSAWERMHGSTQREYKQQSERERSVRQTHFEEVVEVALVRDLAEVDAEDEGEYRLGETREKSHDAVFLLHRLREDDNATGFHNRFGVLQGETLDKRKRILIFRILKTLMTVSVPGPASA
jgi:hypothetical protein